MEQNKIVHIIIYSQHYCMWRLQRICIYVVDWSVALHTKKNTRLREAISPKWGFIATVRYLATGRSFKDMKFSMRISPQS